MWKYTQLMNNGKELLILNTSATSYLRIREACLLLPTGSLSNSDLMKRHHLCFPPWVTWLDPRGTSMKREKAVVGFWALLCMRPSFIVNKVTQQPKVETIVQPWAKGR